MTSRKPFYVLLSFLCFLLITISVNAQDSLSTPSSIPSKSLSVDWTYQQYIDQVAQNHPYTKQLEAILGKFQGEIRMSRSVFDPKLSSSYDYKYFKGKRYFEIIDLQLSVPMPYGFSLRSGYGNTSGYYLNPSLNTPSKGIYNLGVKWNLNQALLGDVRSMQLRLAKKEYERQNLENLSAFNTFLFEASGMYLKQLAYLQKEKAYTAVLSQIDTRKKAVEKQIDLGYKASIDSVKVVMQYLKMQQKKTKVEQNLQKIQQKINYYTQVDQYQSPLVSGKAIAVNGFHHEVSLQDFLHQDWISTRPFRDSISLDMLLVEHPKLQALLQKKENTKLKMRMNNTKFLPKLSVKYDFLNNAKNQWWAYEPEYRKIGVGLQWNTLSRKASGKRLILKESLNELDAKIQDTQSKLKTKVIAIQQQLALLEQQITQQKQLLYLSKTLLDAEQRRYTIGTSSLFLINTREQEYVTQQIKYIDLVYQMAYQQLSLRYALGRFTDYLRFL